MNTKVCTKCDKDLTLDNFNKIKSGTRNGKQRYRHAAHCNECVHEQNTYKTCNICNKKLPKTEEFFNVKVIKQDNAIYYSFRYGCKECLNAKTATQKRQKYWDNPKESRKKNRDKYKANPEKARLRQRNWRRKNPDKVREKDAKRIREISDNWIACSIGIPVADCPKDLLESIRVVRKIKRELGITHSTKKKKQ